jgi:hypothetical protein
MTLVVALDQNAGLYALHGVNITMRFTYFLEYRNLTSSFPRAAYAYICMKKRVELAAKDPVPEMYRCTFQSSEIDEGGEPSLVEPRN